MTNSRLELQERFRELLFCYFTTQPLLTSAGQEGDSSLELICKLQQGNSSEGNSFTTLPRATKAGRQFQTKRQLIF